MDHVAHRYLEPRQGPSPSTLYSMTAHRESFPVNPSMASVTPRYLEPRSPRPEPRPPGIDECTFDVRKHREASVAKFPDLFPRYLDERHYQPRADSPRRQVEERIAQRKRERVLWRNDTTGAHHGTFDDLKRYTDAVERPKTKPVVAPSPVKAYIEHDQPIRHHLNTTDASQSPRRGSPARTGGGSPARSRTPVWHSPGVVERNFDNTKRLTERQTWYTRSERRVQQLTERRLSATVEPAHVPRVAGFALAELAKQRAASLEQQPTYEIEPAPANPDERPHTISWVGREY